MSFVASAFLAGLAALALPWWLHRRETAAGPSRDVSSLLLMQPSALPLRRNRRLQRRILLGLRLLLLAVAALAFAQPVLVRSPQTGPMSVQVPRAIVIDTSMSMAANWRVARRAAHDVIDALPAGAPAAVLLAAEQLVVAAAMDTNKQVLHAAVEAARPGAGRLSFDGLLGRVVAVTGTMAAVPVRTHLISDFQASGMPDQFNRLITETSGDLDLHRIAPAEGNWRVERVQPGDPVEVTIQGFGPGRQVAVTLASIEGTFGAAAVDVPADGRASVAIAMPSGVSQPPWVMATIAPDDGIPADDVAFGAATARDVVPLPVFSRPDADGALAYLRAAVAAAAPGFRVTGPEGHGPVAVLLDPGSLAPDRRQLLERHLARGGRVLAFAGAATQRSGRLGDESFSAPGGSWSARRIVVADGQHAGLPEASWQDVTVWRWLRTDDVVGRVLLALDDGTALLRERPWRGGRLVVLGTALDPAWSTLVTQPVFVDLVGRLLAYLAEDLLPQSAVAGQSFALPADNVQVFSSDGLRMLSLAESGRRSTIRVTEPGIYTLRTPQREQLLAVNPDAREGNPKAAPDALLARWEAAVDAGASTGSAVSAGTTAAAGLPLAPWLLGLLVLLAILEPLAANLGRRAAPVVAPR